MNQILHLGLGRFHRAHQAVYYQETSGWKVVSSTMRSNEERDKLRKVNHRYPVLELSHARETLNWIDCITEALSLKEDLPRLLQVFASPETKIVTLTVTEKGYCLNSSGELDTQHPGIVHDLRSPNDPETAIGFLALGITQRKTKLSILSCDNLRANGKKLQAAVMKFLELTKKDTSWVKENVTFPDTMVDRIVPSLLPEKIKELESRHGLSDSDLVATEEFSQWVIEDHFAGERPDCWAKAGVEFVSDVKPYEEMKLRLLNASHSYLAYAGINRGHQFVHEAISDEELHKTLMQMLKEEVVPVLDVPSTFNVNTYIDDLIYRFRNNKLPHQLRQIAMDGSQKMPQRIFSSIEEAKTKKKSFDLLLSVVDEWCDFLWNSREGKIDDPKASELLQGVELGKDKWKKSLREKFNL